MAEGTVGVVVPMMVVKALIHPLHDCCRRRYKAHRVDAREMYEAHTLSFTHTIT